MFSNSFLKLSRTSSGGQQYGDLEGPRSRPTIPMMALEIDTVLPANDSENEMHYVSRIF